MGIPHKLWDLLPQGQELINLRSRIVENAAWNREHLKMMCENLMRVIVEKEQFPSQQSELEITWIKNEIEKILNRSLWLAKKEWWEPLSYEIVHQEILEQIKSPN